MCDTESDESYNEKEIQRLANILKTYDKRDHELWIKIFQRLRQEGNKFKITKKGLKTTINNISPKCIRSITQEIENYKRFSNRVLLLD